MQADWQKAIVLLQQGDAQGAQACLRRLPLAHAEQDFLQGVCAHALQDIPQAIQHFTQALQRDPAHARAAAALGALLAGMGRTGDAEAVFRKSLRRIDDAQVRFNLAVVLEDTGRPDAALAEYSQLLSQQPDDYAARHNRAGLYARRMQLREAAADYRELIQRHPDNTLPWQNLADIDISQGHYEAALTRLEEVIRREPGNAKAVMSAAIAAAADGQFAVSAQQFQHLQSLDPALWHSALQRINGRGGSATQPEPELVFLVRQLEHLSACDWSRWKFCHDTFKRFCHHPGRGERISLAFRSVALPLTSHDQLALGSTISQQFATTPFPQPTASPVPARLRVGYLGSRFGLHATGMLLRDVLSRHDPDHIEVFLLDLGHDDGSAVSHQLRQLPAQRMIALQDLDDDDAARRIATLELDILVDLNSYNDEPRPGILARHPAAVQVGWLAAPYSSGAPWMDYCISDAQVRPAEGWCSEAEVLMPQSYFVFSHDASPPAAPARHSLGLPDNRFVFACLNSAFRIDPDTFTAWMNILRHTPESVLWLLADSSAMVLNLKREAEWQGIDPRRLLFATRTTPSAHLARLAAADLYLDTRYCNGHTSTAEALWAGLPVLTCPGQTFASRVAGSLLHSCQLPELVMPDATAYEQEAIALYHDHERLQQLRVRLAAARHHAAPFDIAGQTRHLEKAFRHMRQRVADGLPPASFAVADLP
jgi:protein O-GlcNAc transferase